MSPRAVKGSAVWLTLAFVTSVANGCSSANRATPATPENAETAPESANDEPMRPASASLALERREAPTQVTSLSDPEDSPSTAQTKSDLESPPDGSSRGAPDCSMHAENTPGGIALIFTTQTSTPERVAAQVRALAAEIELEKDAVNEATRPQPSSFGTRQIAELTAQTLATETPEGGRLTIDARDPARVDALRARVLWHMASFLPDSRDRRGVCPVVPRAAAEQRERDIERAGAGAGAGTDARSVQ